jgi:tetratricopeptide (TPR) repeat protein
MTTLETFRQRLAAGGGDSLAADLETAIVARRSVRGEHREWALLCEQAGLMSLAFSEFQLALRDDRDDPVAGFHLAQLYRERGDTSRALGLLDRLLQQQPANESWLTSYVEILAEDGAASPLAEQVLQRALEAGLPSDAAQRLRRTTRPGNRPSAASPPAEPQAELAPSDADCVRFSTLFSGREGVYARQWAKPSGESGYTPVHEPLTPAAIRNHLLGSFTAGVYPIRLDGTATFFALDLDIDKQALQRARGEPAYAQHLRDTLRDEGARLLGVLRHLGFAPLFENSGYKGRHFWVLLEEPETAEVLHLLGRLLLAWQSPQMPAGLHLEVFPKQGSVRDKGKGLGNLIKLPLGIHRRTGRRSQLLDDQGTALADPLAALRAVSRSSRATLYAAVERLKALAGSSEPPATIPFAGTPAGDLEEPAKTAASSLPPPPPPHPPGPKPTSRPTPACGTCWTSVRCWPN